MTLQSNNNGYQFALGRDFLLTNAGNRDTMN